MTRLGPPNERFQSLSAYFLAFVMAVGILVMFILRLWINPTLFQTGLFLLAGVWAIALVIRPFKLRFSSVLIPLSAAVGWGLFQLYGRHTLDRSDTWVAVLAWLGNLTAFFLAMQICGSSRVRQRFLDTLLYFGFVLSIVSVVQYFSSEGQVYWFYPTYGGPLLGPFLNRDQYAVFAELLLPLALVKTFRGGPQSLRFAVIAAALYATVIAGASRAGALLTTAELIVIPAIFWAKGTLGSGKLRSATLNVGLLAFVFVAVVGWAVVFSRFQDANPLKGRREMLSDTISMIHAKPYFGFGLGSFRTAYPAYGSIDFGAVVNHAHNDWAEWAADGGIPFSLLVVWIAVWSVPRAFKSIWGVGLVAVFAHSFVDFALQKQVMELWTFVLLGVLAVETGKKGKAGQPGLL